MAHYVGPQITLGEFVTRAVNNYQAREYHDKVNGPLGTTSLRYLRRLVNNVVKIAQLPLLEDHETLTYPVLHSLCRNLGIPPEDFGVPLDLTLIFRDPDDEDD